MSSDEAQDLLDACTIKLNVIEKMQQMTDGPGLTKEEAAYNRYADNILIDPKQRLLFQFPRG